MNDKDQINKEEISFKVIYNLIRKNLVKITAFVVISMAIVFVISFFLPHTYSSYTTVLPPAGNEAGGGLTSFLQSFSGGGMMLGGLGESNQSQVFAEILRSRTVSDKVIQDLKLTENPVFKDFPDKLLNDMIRASISADIDRSGVLSVQTSMSTGMFPGSEDKEKVRQLSADIANSAVKALDEVIRTRNVSAARQSRQYIENELASYKNELDSIEQAVQEFQKENKVLALDEQTQAVVSQAVSIGAELAQAETELNLARLDYAPNSAYIKAMEERVDLLRKQYARMQEGGLTSDEGFAIALSDVPRLAREYATLMRERKILEQVIMYLETQRHQEAIQEEKDIPIVEVLDRALPPDFRTAPNRKLMVILTFMLSIFLAIIFLLAWAFIRGRIYLRKM